MFNNIIVALATPPMEGALAIIRVSGENCFSLLRKIFSNKTQYEGHKLYYGKIKDEEEILDEVLVSTFKKPHSFTGEDSFEISCHGGMFIVERVIALCLKHGAKLAAKGEFTKRAFLNNKIDLIQAEAINDMIRATSEEEASLAVYSLQGQTSNLINNLKDKIIDLVANIEVNIDYPEYDDAEEVTKEIASKKIKDIISDTNQLLKEARIGKMIKDGLNVAIVGQPNVGKSSLLNTLLKEDKAIVTSEAGTTRDIVEGVINLDGLKLNLLDTAGIRKEAGSIEKIGIEKSKETIEKADLVLLLFDGSQPLDDLDKELIKLTKDKNHIKVINKTDLGLKIDIDGVKISTHTKDIDNLLKAIKEKVGYNYDNYQNKPMLTNIRHIGLLKAALENLKEAEKEIQGDIPIDLVNIEIMNALNNIEDILGNKTKMDLHDQIFSKFCLGK